jgi:hypothetical protein
MKKCQFCGEFLSDDALQCKSCQRYLDGKVRAEERCECGNLVAKLTETTVEIKCRRCKRVHVIPMDMLKDRYVALMEKQAREPDDDDDVIEQRDNH